ncbi:GH15 family glucan-1,4-alpha-glucosidase [Pseudarthrobacter oxydans]|uniref:glycoside hydrolase family 15 protein n=1 Tax=Pseudarthrobacter oxydans TaxID=1671 RepID=UPI002784317D|nr:glycoside hydrolase family 15 protein [Pseudarthrobacter oxydans]MDP9983705.1 GH15 family glucan-1,4-alpha-glucosidase [Pseudarthrobacter oxydans]
MKESATVFPAAHMRAVVRRDGYLPIEDHGLIGDGSTCALVGRDGAISWLCIPEFDSPPFLAGILDLENGGCFEIAPVSIHSAAQRYMEDSCVLVTTLASDRGTLQITDCLSLRSGADLVEPVPAGRSELLRHVQAVGGDVRLRIRLEPKTGVTFDELAGGWRFDWHSGRVSEVYLWTSVELAPDGRGLSTELTLRAGETITATLHWSGRFRLRQHPDPRKLIDQTVAAWRRWASALDCQGSQAELMKRSALTLKLLDHAETGAIMAAATSSLPEWPGAPRNWDYRYTWVRDASFSNYVFRRIGDRSDAEVFLAWVLTNVERDGVPHVMYALDGSQPPEEVQDPLLRGYRGSAPVRWGNGAIHQQQHDVYGEIIDIAYQWSSSGARVDARLWAALVPIVELAISSWRTPDSGPWEIRSTGRPFTYSAALCYVAVDRAIQIARKHGLPYPKGRWEAAAKEIREAALTQSWNPELQTFTEHLGGTGGLDAALLTLPVRNVIAFDDPRMVATTKAVAEGLDAGNGLLYRYLPEVSPDGLPGGEGAFLLCSFWLVDNLAGQGRLDEAYALYETLCGRANPLGLLPEQIHPETGEFLGNFPQAFSHVGVLASGLRLLKAGRRAASRV